MKKRFHVEGQTSTMGMLWQIWDGEQRFARFRNIADRIDAEKLCAALEQFHCTVEESRMSVVANGSATGSPSEATQSEREAVLEEARRSSASRFSAYAELHAEKLWDGSLSEAQRQTVRDKVDRNLRYAAEARAALTTPAPAGSQESFLRCWNMHMTSEREKEASMTESVKATQADREHARRIVAEHYGYDVVENVSLHCAEVEFFLKGLKVGRQSQEREAVLEEALRPFAREARWISDAPDVMNKSWANTGLSYGDWHRAAAALTTPAPAEPVSGDTVSRDEIVAVLEGIKARGLPDRYKSDVELNDRLAAIFSRLEVAPAVSADEIDELLYSVTRMPLSNKGGELVRWRKTMGGRLSAILSRIRGEGE